MQESLLKSEFFFNIFHINVLKFIDQDLKNLIEWRTLMAAVKGTVTPYGK